jgi:radical SAM-linked protein
MSDVGRLGPAPTVRVRIRFTKLGKIRWTSHRDVARMWERAFRREQLPLAYSAGFSPRPKVSFGLALPTGCESVAEYLDVELADLGPLDFGTLPRRLSAALPTGVDVTAAELIAPGTPSLQEAVQSCSWRWTVGPAEGSSVPPGEEHQPERLGDRIARLLAAPTVVVTRFRKGAAVTEDIRAGIWDLTLIGPAACPNAVPAACPNAVPAACPNAVPAAADPSHGSELQAELACRPRAIRPSEVTDALASGLEARDVRRTHQWILRDGARWEPLTVAPDDATTAPHALGRAS